jgi:hypothetical protein
MSHHVGWLSVNLAGFAQFIITSLHFVEPKAREQLREKFTANSVIPEDLFRRLLRALYMNAPKSMFPDAEDQTNLYLAFGFSPTDRGEAEIRTFFDSDQSSGMFACGRLRMLCGAGGIALGQLQMNVPPDSGSAIERHSQSRPPLTVNLRAGLRGVREPQAYP